MTGRVAQTFRLLQSRADEGQKLPLVAVGMLGSAASDNRQDSEEIAVIGIYERSGHWHRLCEKRWPSETTTDATSRTRDPGRSSRRVRVTSVRGSVSRIIA